MRKVPEVIGAGLGFLIGAVGFLIGVALVVVMIGGGVVSHSVCVDRQTGEVSTGEWGVDPFSWFGSVNLGGREVCESETGWQFVAGKVPVVGDSVARTLGGPQGLASYVSEVAESDGQEVTARRLLDSWAVVLVANLRLQQASSKAVDAGHMERATMLERRALRGLPPIEKFGRDARTALIDSDSSGSVTRAGDAWSEWAYVLRTDPPRGDFDKARHIAGLGVKAVRLQREAYRAIGAPIPAAFQIG
jgi:hypothetical protein